MIPTDFIQTLLSRVDIVEVIDRYVPLRKAGANYVACCPFHNEKTPSFSVSPGKQFYHCFGCGAHGTAIGFLMEYGGKAFPDAVEELARDAGMDVPRVERPGEREKRDEAQDLNEILLTAAKFYRSQLKDAPRAIDYLKSRGLTGEIAARFGIGYAPDAWRGLEAVFPSVRRAGTGRRRPGDQRRRRQALRPVPGPGDVPHPRQPRPRDRLRRQGDGRRRTQVPQFAGNARSSPRVGNSMACTWPATPSAMPGASSSSKATWTSSHWHNMVSSTPLPRWAPRPRRRTCRSCSG